MAVKNTIAIIASTKEKAEAALQKFSPENFRILLIAKDEEQLLPLHQKIQSEHPETEVDVLSCMKDGCWEADIIIVNISCDEEEQVAKLIKEVATQKLVISFSEKEGSGKKLTQLLKHSKVVNVFVEPGSCEFSLEGDDREALEYVSKLLKKVETI